MNKNSNIDKHEALGQMQKLCSGREKCSFDIRYKLRSTVLSEEDKEWVVDQLQKDRFVDDERYAGFYVRDRLRFSKWGKMKIRQALENKQIQDNIIRKVLNAINEEEYLNILRDELRKKQQSINDKNPWSVKAKLFRFGSGRGFEAGRIYRVIDEIME